MFLFKRKNDGKDSPDLRRESTDDSAVPLWHQSLPGETYKKWPKNDGQPEEPVAHPIHALNERAELLGPQVRAGALDEKVADILGAKRVTL